MLISQDEQEDSNMLRITWNSVGCGVLFLGGCGKGASRICQARKSYWKR